MTQTLQGKETEAPKDQLFHRYIHLHHFVLSSSTHTWSALHHQHNQKTENPERKQKKKKKKEEKLRKARQWREEHHSI